MLRLKGLILNEVNFNEDVYKAKQLEATDKVRVPIKVARTETEANKQFF